MSDGNNREENKKCEGRQKIYYYQVNWFQKLDTPKLWSSLTFSILSSALLLTAVFCIAFQIFQLVTCGSPGEINLKRSIGGKYEMC